MARKIVDVLEYLTRHAGAHVFRDESPKKTSANNNLNIVVSEEVELLCRSNERFIIPANSHLTMFRHPRRAVAGTVACFFHPNKQAQTVIQALGFGRHQDLSHSSIYDHKRTPRRPTLSFDSRS